MVKRRSLDDALTPEKQAFLESGTPKPAKKSKPKEKKEIVPMNRPAPREEFMPQPPSPQAQLPQAAFGGAYALNTRLDPLISTALLRASMERKIQRTPPFSQRDITNEALTDWLKKHGYLK